MSAPLFNLHARSVENLAHHNNSCPGSLNDITVYLNNDERFTGSIYSFDQLQPVKFSAKINGEVRDFEFGTESNQVREVTCNGRLSCNTESFHVAKPLEVYAPFPQTFASDR